MNIEVLPARIESLQEAASDEERSAQILKRVEQARAMQDARYSGTVIDIIHSCMTGMWRDIVRLKQKNGC